MSDTFIGVAPAAPQLLPADRWERLKKSAKRIDPGADRWAYLAESLIIQGLAKGPS